MRYPESNDPEVLRFHRMRAAFGATVLVFFAVGFAGLALTALPRPELLSVNCVETTPPRSLIDAETGRVGCTPAVREEPAPQVSGSRMTAPAADATTDNPPVPTF